MRINLTLQCVLASIVAVKINKYYMFWVCVWGLRYLACNPHAPSRHLWSACLCIFVHIIPQTARFWGGKCYWIWIVCVLFSLQLLSETLLVLRRIKWDINVNVHSTAQHGRLSKVVLCCGLEKNGMVGAWHGHGTASVNQTRPHCVNQMGKTHSKPLAARHGRGTAWARHDMCDSAFIGYDTV